MAAFSSAMPLQRLALSVSDARILELVHSRAKVKKRIEIVVSCSDRLNFIKFPSFKAQDVELDLRDFGSPHRCIEIIEASKSGVKSTFDPYYGYLELPVSGF